MITKILASTAAISFALTATAFAQDKSAAKPSDTKTETAEQKAAGPLALGLGAIVAVGAVNDGGGEQTGAPDAQVMGSGSGAGKANFQDLSLAASPSGGEDRLTENVTIAGGGGGKVDVQDINIIKYAKDPKLGPIKGESADRMKAEGFIPLAGAALGVDAPAPCVTEDGAVDADCNGVADTEQKTEDTRFDRRDIRKRPEPRQQRR